MKTRILLTTLCVGWLAAPTFAAYGPPVLETPTEFFAYGDFWGNGRRSYVVIDRVSGGMRAANTNGAGGLGMPNATATGLTDITGVAIGRFTLTANDAVAVTAPDANRVRIVGPVGALFDVWPPGVGPRHVTGLALPGGTSGLDDMICVTTQNSPILFGQFWRGLMLNGGSLSFSTWLTQYPSVEPESPLAVVMVDGEAATYADLQEGSKALNFAIYDAQNAPIPILTQRSGIPLGSRVVYGTFNPSHARSVFVFHVPGSNAIKISTLDATRQLGALVSVTLSAAADWLQPIQAGSEVWLAALTRGGSDLRLYSFDSSSIPSLEQTIAAPSGRDWTGLVPAADGGWFAASALHRQPSGTLQRYNFSGRHPPFTAGYSYDLTALRTEELGSDVLLFNGKPFTDNNPILRGRYRAGGWSSQLNDEPQFFGTIEGQIESWRGATLGLGSPTTSYLGILPAGVTHGLANQIAANASFYSLDAPIGGLADLITFDPPGGAQTVGIEVTLTAADPNTSIRYALGTSTRWLTYTDPIGPLFGDTTVRAYGVNGSVKTPIQSATYTFPAYPGDVDSDGDGLPDFVETQNGLDPLTSGLDSDGDGCPDLLEILIGTDPTDALDVPASSAIMAYSRYFQLSVEPKSHAGTAYGSPLVLAPSVAPAPPISEGTWVTISRPDGSLEMEGNAINQPGGVMLLDLQRTVPNPPLFWVAGTPNRFMIDVHEHDRVRGRGVYRLLDYTAPPLDPLPRPSLTGTPTDQASQWVAAVRSHFQANARVAVGGPVSFTETVDLLLAENALGRIFQQRGWIPTAKLSLTPFRGDSQISRWTPPAGTSQPDRYPVSEAWLAELPSAAYGDNGYDWTALLAFIRTGVISPTITRSGLDALAREAYRIGYHAFDDAQNPLNLAPFEALRTFLDTGVLPREYGNLLTTPAAVLTQALAYRNAFGKALPERDHTAAPLRLIAGANFFQDPWLVLETDPGGVSHWLADPQGKPFPQPSGFRILPGCRFLVTGHLSDHAGGGNLLMVDSISLLDALMPGRTDTDRNLLVDNWESFHFGILGTDPFSDSDHDNYPVLQEMFENTDPRYTTDYPTVPPLELRPPSLSLQYLYLNHCLLTWRWPARYHDWIQFQVERSQNLTDFALLRSDVPATSGDLFQPTVDGELAAAKAFFRVGLKLRETAP